MALVQPVDGFNESEGLAGAGLHQHVQRQRRRQRGRHFHRARRHLVGLADAFDVVAQRRVRLAGHVGGVGVHAGWFDKAHIGEYIGDALHGLGLVG